MRLASADLNCPPSNGREQRIAESVALPGERSRAVPDLGHRLGGPPIGCDGPEPGASPMDRDQFGPRRSHAPDRCPTRGSQRGAPAQQQSNRPNSCVCFACGPGNGILLGHARNSIWPSRKKGTADTRSALATAFHGPFASWAIRNEQIRTCRAIRDRQRLSRRFAARGLLRPRGRVGHVSPEDHRRRAIHRPLPLGQCASLGCISRKAWQVRRTPSRV